MTEFKFVPHEEKERLERILLANMHLQATVLGKLLEEMSTHRNYEDLIYRFYHQSYKVFYLQAQTEQIVSILIAIAPEGRPFCEFFQQIVAAGIGREFQSDTNERWVECTAPIATAFFHARYFLEIAARYALRLKEPPQMLPSGWAALLELYGIR